MPPPSGPANATGRCSGSTRRRDSSSRPSGRSPLAGDPQSQLERPPLPPGSGDARRDASLHAHDDADRVGVGSRAGRSGADADGQPHRRRRGAARRTPVRMTSGVRYTIVLLDADYMKNEMLPALAQQHFQGTGDGFDYQLAVVPAAARPGALSIRCCDFTPAADARWTRRSSCSRCASRISSRWRPKSAGSRHSPRCRG